MSMPIKKRLLVPHESNSFWDSHRVQYTSGFETAGLLANVAVMTGKSTSEGQHVSNK